MNSIVLELQRESLDSKISIVQLLRKALLISRKLGLADFESWINSELNGYENGTQIPDYRIVRGSIQAYNPYNGIWMPIFFESAKESELLSSRKISQKITELEKLSEKDNQSQLHVPFPNEIETRLVKRLDVPSRPVLIVPYTSLIGIIETVRNIILDWTMKLESEGILGDGINFSEKDKTNAISNNQINITNFQGIIGNINNSEIQQNNKLSINKNDFESLKNYLTKELKLQTEDVAELENAIKADEKPSEIDKYGKNVSQWLGKMISKAASGLLNLSVNTAANVLGIAISKYYGL